MCPEYGRAGEDEGFLSFSLSRSLSLCECADFCFMPQKRERNSDDDATLMIAEDNAIRDFTVEETKLYLSGQPPNGIFTEHETLSLINYTLHLVWTPSVQREGHILSYCFNSADEEPEERRYCFVGVKFVELKDEECVLGWCSNPQCPLHARCYGASACFQVKDFHDDTSIRRLGDWKATCPFS